MPLVANGRMSGGLVIYRPAGATFTPEEVALVERLGKQLALAVATARLAEEAREAAVERERAVVARRHAEELERANSALRQAIEGLARIEDVDEFLDVLLRAAMEVSGAHGGTIALLTPAGVDQRVLYDIHGAVPRERSLAEGTAILPLTPAIEQMLRDIVESPSLWSVPVARQPNPDTMIAFHQRNGTRAILVLPLLAGTRLVGYLGLGFAEEEPAVGRQATLLRVLADQATTAVELARLAEQARSAATAEAIATERNRLAREVHDSLAQCFTSIAMQTEALLAGLHPASSLGERLAVIDKTARRGLIEARAAVFALQPVGDGLGEIERALRELCESCNVEGAIACDLRTRLEPCVLTADVCSAVLRVAQEAVTNALRHSQGHTILVQFEVCDGEAVLSVTDDGVGCDAYGRHDGFGITGMRTRTESLGGALTVFAGPAGCGTTVRMRVDCAATKRVAP